MESYEKIKLSKGNLNLAVALLTAAHEGVITKSIITKYIYPSATRNSKWSPLQVADNTHLVRELNNQVRAAFAFSAITTHKILSFLFSSNPLEETDSYRRNILCAIKLISNAFDIDMIIPTWKCSTKYQQEFRVDDIDFVLDARNLNERPMTWDDFGGLGKYADLITCCEELAYGWKEPDTYPSDYCLQQNNQSYADITQHQDTGLGLASNLSTTTQVLNLEGHPKATHILNSLDPSQFPSVDPKSAANFVSTQMVTNQADMVLAKDAYLSYVKWCELECVKPLTQRSFGMQLTNMGFSRKRRGKGHHWWTGLTLAH